MNANDIFNNSVQIEKTDKQVLITAGTQTLKLLIEQLEPLEAMLIKLIFTLNNEVKDDNSTNEASS